MVFVWVEGLLAIGPCALVPSRARSRPTPSTLSSTMSWLIPSRKTLQWLLIWDSRRLISSSIPVLETSLTSFAVPAFLSSSSPSADAPAALDPPTLSTDDNSQAAEEADDDDDAPPPFPLPDSHQRSSAPSQTPLPPPPPPPTFSLTPADDQLRDPLADDDDEPLPRSRGKGKALATPTTTTKVIKTREKVVLEVGFSALDWSRVQRSGVWKDGPLRVRILFLSLSPTHSPSSCLALRSQQLTPNKLSFFLGVRAQGHNLPPHPIRVTPSLLASHKDPTKGDVWTAINGRVYNMTPYAGFHPGGVKELMRCAGRDGTKLFSASSLISCPPSLSHCLSLRKRCRLTQRIFLFLLSPFGALSEQWRPTPGSIQSS